MGKNKPGTICVQGGWQPKNGEPRQVPIYQSTTFKYDDSDQMARLFDLKESGYFLPISFFVRLIFCIFARVLEIF